MKTLTLTKNNIPLLIALICCIEISIYLWSVWTSTFDRSNFFAVHPTFIFDKCARNSARVSSAIMLVILSMVGFNGLKKIYADDNKRDLFLVLLTLFSVNHLVHLLFVLLRFRSHGEAIDLHDAVNIGGILHGLITFAFIIVMPFVIWHYKRLHKLLYFAIIFHLFNISCFIVKTFLSKIKPPDQPAYHNQFGIVVITAACFYILYSIYRENKQSSTPNN